MIRKYIYGPGIDNPVAMVRRISTTDNWYYYYTDALGSVRLLTNAAGVVVESYTYDPYGNPRVMRGSNGVGSGPDGNWLTEDTTTYTTSSLAIGNPIMFTARWWDSTTKLYYYRFRDYSPTLGRFLQPDPIGYADSMNLYAYCGNNPVNWIDPWGLFRFGYRKLCAGTPGSQYYSWFSPILRGLLNYLNNDLYHEAGFYDDGSGDVADFGGSGNNEDRSKYTMWGRRYDDDLMRRAQANVDARWRERGAYDKWTNNCQDYCSELRKEYKRLEKEEEKKKGS